MRFPRADRDALAAAVASIAPDRWSDAHSVAARDAITASTAARVGITAALAKSGWEPSSAVRHLQWAPIGRARLEAALVGVTDGMLDQHPFPGEWSIRQQCAHVQLTYERYSVATLYAAQRAGGDPLLPGPDAYPLRKGEPQGIPGESVLSMVERLRAAWDGAIEPLLAIPSDALQRPTEWHTAEHTVGFRLHRFGAHDLELATDIRATAGALGVRMTAPLSWAAALTADLGELEAVLLDVPAAVGGVAEHIERACASDRGCRVKFR